MTDEIIFNPMPSSATIIPLPDFLRDVRVGGYGNDDGAGYYATKDEMSNVAVDCYKIFLYTEKIPVNCRFVAWFSN